MGHGRLCSAVSLGPDLVIWFVLHQRVVRCVSVPLHHLQHFPGHVYLYLPLPASEESKCSLIYVVLPEPWQQLVLTRSAYWKFTWKKRNVLLNCRFGESTANASDTRTAVAGSRQRARTAPQRPQQRGQALAIPLVLRYKHYWPNFHCFQPLLMWRSVMRHISYWNEMKHSECLHLLQYCSTDLLCFFYFFLFYRHILEILYQSLYDGLYHIVNHTDSCSDRVLVYNNIYLLSCIMICQHLM